MQLHFTKMEGCANDYIYLDCRTTGVPENIEALCRNLSRRHFSVGADGIICICAPVTAGAHGRMRMFNADGSEGAMCGNGVRCVAQWLAGHEPALAGTDPLVIDTGAGPKTLYRAGAGQWRVDMGQYSTRAADLPAQGLGDGPLVNVPLPVYGHTWPVTCISVGNPHCVTIVEDTEALDLPDIGPGFEKHVDFPQRVNTEFVQVIDATHLKMRVWERGSGETWACGTGTCATVAAMVEQGICAPDTDVQVQLYGGVLTIRVQPDKTVWMTGPARVVYEAVVEV